MRFNKTLLILTSFFVMLFGIGLISANGDVVSPASNSVISGTSVTLNATGTNLLNCTFYAMSPSTANNTWTLLGTFSNTTDSATSISGTFNSEILEDSNDYSFNATCRDTSNTLLDGSITTGVTIDNTIPQAPTSLSPSDKSIDTDGTITFSATVVGANTTGCTLHFVGISPGSGGTSRTMTHSGDSCTLTISNIPAQTYTWFIRASDGSNTTDSSQVQVTVSTAKAKTTPEIQREAIKTLSLQNKGELDSSTIVWAIIIIIILVILYTYFK